MSSDPAGIDWATVHATRRLLTTRKTIHPSSASYGVLLATARGFAKSTRPHIARVHPREQLFLRLERALDGGVVWVHGPPGAGKTVLVSSWIEQHRLSALWFQLDPADSDEATLFHSLAQAAQRAIPDAKLPNLSVEALAEVGAYSRSFFRAMFAAHKSPRVLVFDDYHVLTECSCVHAQLADGVEECPPGTRVIMLSRHEPPAAWARLRVRERLELLRPEELLLSEQESAAIVALRTKSPDPELAARLHLASGGWAAGLVLLLETRGNERNVDSSGSLFGFLAAEVFARVDPEAQSALLVASLLPDFDETLVAALSGVACAGQVLSRFARRGYFTVRLERTGWFRFHPLFRDFLHQRANAVLGEKRVGEIQARAAHLLSEEGRGEDALELASQAGAWDELVPLVLTLAKELLREGRAKALAGYIEALPEERRQNQPWLLFWHALACRPFNLSAAYETLEQAYGEFVSRDDAAGIVLSWSALVMSYLWSYQPVPEIWSQRLAVAERALACASRPELESALAEAAMGMLLLGSPQDPALARWQLRAFNLTLSYANEPASFAMGCQLHFTYAFWGLDLPRARLLQDALGQLIRSAQIDPAGTILWLLSESYCHCHAADPVHSVDAARRALSLAADTSYHYWDVLLHAAIVQAELIQGDFTAAKQATAALLSAGSAPGTPLLLRAAQHHVCGLLALQEGNRRRAGEEANVALRIGDELKIPLGQALIRVLWAFVGDAGTLETRLSEAMRWSKDTGYKPGEFACGVGMALCALHAGNMGEAREHLMQALGLGRDQGLYSTASLISRRDWSDLCAFALENGIEPEYIAELIQRRRLPASDSARSLREWPWSVRVLALEGFVVQGGSIQPKGRKGLKKPYELLRLLVEAGSKGGTPDHLAAALWPDAEGDHALQSFHTTLHRLREYLGDSDLVLHSDGRFMLNSERVFVDVWAVEHLVKLMERLDHEALARSGRPHESKRLRGQLIALWDPTATHPQMLQRASIRRLQSRVQRVLAPAPT